MKESKYPDAGNEPDIEYNDYISEASNNAMDNAILNSSALAKNSGKDNNYTYSDTNTLPASHLPPNLSKKKTFKEKWLETDICCEHCGSVTQPAKGFTRQNIDRLLSLKGDPTNWIMFFLLCMCLFFAYTSYSFMTTPINCTNASTLLTQQQNNINGNNQMPDLNNITLPILNTSYCQTYDPNSSTYCQNITFYENE